MRTLVLALGLPLLLLACTPKVRPDPLGPGGASSTSDATSASVAVGTGGSGGGATATTAAGTGGSGGAAVASSTAGAGGTGGAASTGSTGGAGGGGTGNCTNAADTAIFAATDVLMICESCGINELGQEPATKDCIKNGTGLSDPCVGCFDDTIQCIVMSCFNECASAPDSQPCKDCRALNCDPALNACSGLIVN